MENSRFKGGSDRVYALGKRNILGGLSSSLKESLRAKGDRGFKRMSRGGATDERVQEQKKGGNLVTTKKKKDLINNGRKNATS